MLIEIKGQSALGDIYKHQVSPERMNEILKKEIPLELRLKSVYIPIFTLNCAFITVSHILSLLRQLKSDDTKHSYRKLGGGGGVWRKNNLDEMGDKMYECVSTNSKNLYDRLNDDLSMFEIQYSMVLNKYNFTRIENKILSKCYMVYQMLGYVLVLDKKYCKQFNEILGGSIDYQIEEDELVLKLRELVSDIVWSLGGMKPDDVYNNNIGLSFQIFKNAIDNIKFEEDE